MSTERICRSVGLKSASECERRRCLALPLCLGALSVDGSISDSVRNPCSLSSFWRKEVVRRLRSCFDSRGFNGRGACNLNLPMVGIGRKRRLWEGRNMVAACSNAEPAVMDLGWGSAGNVCRHRNLHSTLVIRRGREVSKVLGGCTGPGCALWGPLNHRRASSASQQAGHVQHSVPVWLLDRRGAA